MSRPPAATRPRRAVDRWAARLVLGCLTTGLVATGLVPVVPVGTTAQAAPVAAMALPAVPTGLDRTGATLPKSSYPIPAGAVFMSPTGDDRSPGTRAAPVRTVNAAVRLARDGGTVVLRGGLFRDWFHDPAGTSYGFLTKSLTFQAYPGESPWFDGTDRVATSRWTKVKGKNLWSMRWQTPSFCDGQYYSRPLRQQRVQPNAGPCAHFDMSADPKNPLAVDPQLLFVDGVGLHEATSRSAVTKGSFAYDWKARTLYLGVSPKGRLVEAAARPVALVLSNKGRGFRILGVGFRRYATNEFHNLTSSAVYVGGSVIEIENSVFAENAAGALNFSNPRPGSVVRRTVFARNGYTPLGGSGTSRTGQRNDLVVDGNVFYRNNTERFGTGCSVSCGQAAAKFAHMVGLTLSGNLVEQTQGTAGGLWCDLDCTDATIIYNTVRDNPGAGIFYEVSSRGLIAGNVVEGSSYGVVVASATTRVYHNTLVDNVQGINVYDDGRTRGQGGWDDVGPDTRGVEVVANVVSGRNYSLMASSKLRSAPPNTTTDDLFARVDENVVHQSNGSSPIFVFWRDRGGRVTPYRSRARFSADRGFEAGGSWLTGAADPLFVDRAHGDFRIRPGSPADRAGSDLPADVARAMGVAVRDPRRRAGAFART